jgi:hypothetical protein
VIFDHLARFVRNMGTTKVDQLTWRLSSEPDPPNRWQVLKFFRKLEELCCGRVIEGRWGKKTRFEWSANLVDVARAAQGQDVQIGSASNEIEVEEAAGEQHQEETKDENLVEHPYLLRKDLHVRLELPADLTAAEAARLARFIQTLPFEQGDTVPA